MPGLLCLGLSLCLSLWSAPSLAENISLDEAPPTLSGRLHRSSVWPEGPTVLLLHGTLSHRDTEIIESLELLFGDLDLSTLAINLSLGVDDRDRAFPCDTLHRHREDDAIVELERWVSWLKAQGADDITLLGHSRGANQALRYVLGESSHSVGRLVLVAPTRWNPEDSRRSYRQRHATDLDPLLAQASQQIADGRGNDPLPPPVGLLYCPDAQVTAASFASYYDDNTLRDTPTNLAAATVPTLVIAGSEDRVVPGLADAVRESAPDVPVVEIDGADHFFRDLYADELVEAVAEFMGDTE